LGFRYWIAGLFLKWPFGLLKSSERLPWINTLQFLGIPFKTFLYHHHQFNVGDGNSYDDGGGSMMMVVVNN